MRPEHAAEGDPCSKCGRKASTHRKRERSGDRHREGYVKEYRKTHERKDRKPKAQSRIIGVDGEGRGRSPHLYTYLAASDEHGKTWSTKNEKGLSTEQCLDLFLSLPVNSLIVGYAFFYDLTMLLQDLPDALLYRLFHEETRRKIINGRVTYAPIKWRGYHLNFMNRRLSVRRMNRRVTVWDIFRFFSCKFTQALTDWQIADPESLTRMAEMKDKRAIFDQLSNDEVESYCNLECLHLAKLARKLLEAHVDVGIPLRSYFGAGSTASSFLQSIKVKQFQDEPPVEMRHAIACAFFGGRFENSLIGPIKKKVYSYDIASAYPYATYFLPCLTHGSWEHIRTLRTNDRRIREATVALIHWRLPRSEIKHDWGPFPLRSKDGTISFPTGAQGGWSWSFEFLRARTIWPHVEISEAWLFHADCDHRPFASVPTKYLERLRLGDDSKGIVLKLGLNSIYGKLAQSKGINPPYQSWVWAGLITSATRAQLMHAMKPGSGCFMVATDGIYSTKPIDLPIPKDTGTFDAKKPLGSWVAKTFEHGVFAVRPGIYFPLDFDEGSLKEVKGRGLGKSVLYDYSKRIIEAWDKKEPGLSIKGITRFIGAKSALTKGPKSGITRSERYGEWIEHQIDVSFDPRPKRECIVKGNRLKPWGFFDWESVPYDAAIESTEARLLREFEVMTEEQPDIDFNGC